MSSRWQRIHRSTYDEPQDSGIDPPSTVPSLVGSDKGIVESPVEGEDLAGQLVFAKVSCDSVRRSARVIVAGEGNAPAVDSMLRDGSRRRQFRQDLHDCSLPFDDWDIGVFEIHSCIGQKYVRNGCEVQSIEGDRVICGQLFDPVDIADNKLSLPSIFDRCTERCLAAEEDR